MDLGGKHVFRPHCTPEPGASYMAEDAVQLLMLQVELSARVDACGGGGSIYSMTLQNQPIETSQLPHVWLWTFEGGFFMLLVELPDLWLKGTLFVGSPTCLRSFLTPRKCSLSLASRAITLDAHFRVCFRAFQAKSGSAIPASFHQGCEPMLRSSQLVYFLVTWQIIRQCVWYCVFSKLSNWAL